MLYNFSNGDVSGFGAGRASEMRAVSGKLLFSAHPVPGLVVSFGRRSPTKPSSGCLLFDHFFTIPKRELQVEIRHSAGHNLKSAA
jgi:hypothetical protein